MIKAGQRFGMLVAIGPINGGKFWLCNCDCGGTTRASKWHLLHGRRRSCGCRKRPPEELVTCKKCGKPKSRDEFYKRANGRIYYKVCKECWSATCSERSKVRHHSLRLEALEHYGNGHPQCACCGEDRMEFLAIDHIYGGGGQHRKKEGIHHLVRWLKKNGYPPGFRVLCHNCNFSLGAYGYCPHQHDGTSKLTVVSDKPDGIPY